MVRTVLGNKVLVEIKRLGLFVELNILYHKSPEACLLLSGLPLADYWNFLLVFHFDI